MPLKLERWRLDRAVFRLGTIVIDHVGQQKERRFRRFRARSRMSTKASAIGQTIRL